MPSTLISLSDIIRLNGWFKFFSIRTSSTILFAYCRSVQLRNWMRNVFNMRIFASIGTGILWLAGIILPVWNANKRIEFFFCIREREEKWKNCIIFLWYFSIILCLLRNKNCILGKEIIQWLRNCIKKYNIISILCEKYLILLSHFLFY